MTAVVEQLRDRLALVRRTFGSLGEYARVRVQLLDAEAEAALEEPAAPALAEAMPIRGGGVQLLG